MYDAPYRLEENKHGFAIVSTAEGVIATGDNYMVLRRLIEAANEITNSKAPTAPVTPEVDQ